MHWWWLVAKSCPTLAIPWTIARHASLSMEFSREEYWSRLPFLSPGDLPDPGIKPGSPALQILYQLSHFCALNFKKKNLQLKKKPIPGRSPFPIILKCDLSQITVCADFGRALLCNWRSHFSIHSKNFITHCYYL